MPRSPVPSTEYSTDEHMNNSVQFTRLHCKTYWSEQPRLLLGVHKERVPSPSSKSHSGNSVPDRDSSNPELFKLPIQAPSSFTYRILGTTSADGYLLS